MVFYFAENNSFKKISTNEMCGIFSQNFKKIQFLSGNDFKNAPNEY